MSLRKKTKKAFAKTYDRIAPFGGVAGLLAVIGTSFGVGFGLEKDAATSSPAPISAAQAAQEERWLGMGLSNVVAQAAVIKSQQDAINQLEREGKPTDEMELAQARNEIFLDRTVRALTYHALVRSNLPEARYDELIAPYEDGEKTFGLTPALSDILEQTEYRDECRLDLAAQNTGKLSERDEANFVGPCARKAGSGNDAAALFSGELTTIFSVVGFGFLAGALGRRRRRWGDELEADEREADRRARLEQEIIERHYYRAAFGEEMPSSVQEEKPKPKPRPQPKMD